MMKSPLRLPRVYPQVTHTIHNPSKTPPPTSRRHPAHSSLLHQRRTSPVVPDTAAPARPSADTPSCADSACLCESHPPYAPRNSPVPYRPQSRRLTHHLPSAPPGSPPSPAQPSAVRAASRPLMPGDSAFLGAAFRRSRDNRLLRQSAICRAFSLGWPTTKPPKFARVIMPPGRTIVP